MRDGAIKAVLGPTNTGKTHLAIERMCGHSSGAIGFPLRLLAREVYDRVRAIKGEKQVALITGEERIEPPDARYFLCTAEAMPVTGDYAFVALDEAQLAADPERGHIFTDRMLHARGREETMLLGSATLEPIVTQLFPRAELIERPRFSTLRYTGSAKLSRLPPRSAVVAFSAEQVYAMAEMLRRFRGGAAVVMGALSPETRNKQVELFQNGEVDYIVATDAIGMGLNLDLHHVAFASLSKFDGKRKRRLSPSEMAQIAGRAGRHQRDGTFGTLTGLRGSTGMPNELSEEEIYAIEEHRFQPLSHIFWREAEPRFDSLPVLIGDLESPPPEEMLRAAPQAIDLAVLKNLAESPIAESVKGGGAVKRFWEVCQLPDFRSVGADNHARFVARLWQDLRQGYLGADYVAARIAELDRTQGDIDTLQGRIAAIRSWAYICQRPDWVLARDEMAARARGVEARLSDALHARLTERFVNRRTSILMKSLGQNGAQLPVELSASGQITVEGESIGKLDGFRFAVDPNANASDRKMLLAAAEKALPGLLSRRADWLLAEGLGELSLARGAICWEERELARIVMADDFGSARLEFTRDVTMLEDTARRKLESGLQAWLAPQLEALAPLGKLAEAARDPAAGSEARALLYTLIARHGLVARENAGLEHLPKELRPFLRKLGVTFGALDVFAPALLKPAARRMLHAVGLDKRPCNESMLPVLSEEQVRLGPLPAGYRLAGSQAIRVDLAEKILRAAFKARVKVGEDRNGRFAIDEALGISIGLEAANLRRLLGSAGFRLHVSPKLAEGLFGPPVPDLWSWRPRRSKPHGQDRTDGRSEVPHRRSSDRRGNKPGGQHRGKRGKGARHMSDAKRHDPGPARAGGAFDSLADLLKP